MAIERDPMGKGNRGGGEGDGGDVGDAIEVKGVNEGRGWVRE